MREPWYKKLAAIQRKRGKSRIIPDRQGINPYLERIYTLPRWASLGLLRLNIHQFLASDDVFDGLHDHPWPYLTIILEGGYIEWLPDGKGGEAPHHRQAGDIIAARSTRRHRIELLRDFNNEEIPCWTFFVMGPKRRGLGFWINGKFYSAGEWFARRAHGGIQ